MIIDIQLHSVLEQIKSLARIFALINFPNDAKKRADFELGILSGLSDAGVNDIKDELWAKVPLSRLISATSFDTLEAENRTREYLTIFDLVTLMIRANATGGVIAKRNSLNRAVNVLSARYDAEPKLNRIHGLSNIIGTWGKYKAVSPFIFAYIAFLGSFDEQDDKNTTEVILLTLSTLANYASQSLQAISSLKLQGQLYQLPTELEAALTKLPIPLLSEAPFTPAERKEWLAYRAHYEAKPKKEE